MTGRIININEMSGLLEVNIESGTVSIEMLGIYDVDIGDILSGEFELFGLNTLYNNTKNQYMSIFKDNQN